MKTILRAPHNAAHPFTRVTNLIAKDRTLSLRARGLALLILSERDTFAFSAERLAEYTQESPHIISRAIKELEQAGFIRRERGPGGRNALWTRLVFEELSTPQKVPVKGFSSGVSSGGTKAAEVVHLDSHQQARFRGSKNCLLEEVTNKTHNHLGQTLPHTDVCDSQKDLVEGDKTMANDGRSSTARTNAQLADYFMTDCLKVAVRDFGARPVGPVDKARLAAMIKRQRAATGATAEEVMRMMETYVLQPAKWNKFTHPAYDFASGNTFHRLRNSISEDSVETPVDEPLVGSAEREFYAEIEGWGASGG